MEKKIYQAPNTELIHMNIMTHLLDWSAWGDIGEDGEEAEASRNSFDEGLDFFDDDEIEPVWSFNVWE